MMTLLVVSGTVALAWTALALRLFFLSRSRWFRFLGPPGWSNASLPRVDAVIPARNEEEHIAATVEALRRQDYPALTITVVDDESTDATAAILDRLASRDAQGVSLRFIRGVPRPSGWVGKTWAVHQGVAGTTAGWIWFVDADMGLHPEALRAAVVEGEATGADLVSFLPGVQCRTFWQGTIASAFLQLLGQLYPLDRVNDPGCPEAIAAGGFLLVRRVAYESAGGHAAVRNAIVEDIELARRVKADGRKLLVRLAPALAWTHMYGSFGQIWAGLRKNAYAGMDFKLHKFATGAIIALLLAWSPWIALIAGMVRGQPAAVSVGLWGIMAQGFASAPILVFLQLPVPFAFTLPAGITAYVAIATSSVWHYHRGRILWKGRSLSASVSRGTPPSGME